MDSFIDILNAVISLFGGTDDVRITVGDLFNKVAEIYADTAGRAVTFTAEDFLGDAAGEALAVQTPVEGRAVSAGSEVDSQLVRGRGRGGRAALNDDERSTFAETERRLEEYGETSETAEAFKERTAAKGHRIVLGTGDVTGACYKSNRLTPDARNVGRILNKYGVKYAHYKEGEINYNGITQKLTKDNACTVGRNGQRFIFVNGEATGLVKTIAFHEMYRYFKGTTERSEFENVMDSFIDI